MMKPNSNEVTTDMQAKIDFKKYRSPELAASVTEIVDVRGKLAGGFKTAFLAFVAFLALAGILFWFKGDLTTFGLAAAYSLFAGAIFSLALAIAGVVKRSLTEMEQLVGLLFSTTNQVAEDVNSLSEGDAALPSARELVEGVYGDVLLPAVEQVVAQSLGLVGKPILFAYRMTLGRVVRGAIKLVPDTALAKNEAELSANANTIMNELSTIADEKFRISSALTWTQDQLGNIGSKAKFLVLLPCYVIATVVAAVVLIPLGILYFWF